MDLFVKGMTIEKYIGYSQTVQFDLVDNLLVIIMNRENIDKYPLSVDFEFRFQVIYNTLFLLFRYGDCPWMSAPYTPHLSNKFEPMVFCKGEGLALTVLLVCNDDGIIYDMAICGLSTSFSNLIYCAAEFLYRSIPFDFDEHRMVIASVYKNMTDEELAGNCDIECRCVV